MPVYLTNFSDPREKGVLLRGMNGLHGMHTVKITKVAKGATSAQHRYYRGVIIPAFTDWSKAQGEPISPDLAHAMFAFRFLRETVVGPGGLDFGEATRSTSTLSVGEFQEFITQVSAWLAHTCGIHIDGGSGDE